MRAFVTGAAGFIGSNLVERLIAEGHRVVGWDNLSTGRSRFLDEARKNAAFEFREGDNLDTAALRAAMKGCDTVFHLAANADVRFGLQHPALDLQQNTIATFNILEAMRENEVRTIAFASTGSVYGETAQIPTPETAAFPIQTSLYGASKLACEGLISAYTEGYGMEGYIFRFVSILGERYTHGHVFDFYKQLQAHPEYLDILGDGHQRKSYLYVGDCISALVRTITAGTARHARHRVEISNLGTEEFCTVHDSISWICQRLRVTPELRFAGGTRGWVGDNPFIFLDTAKIRETGWRPQLSIREAIERTVDYLSGNPWVLGNP